MKAFKRIWQIIAIGVIISAGLAGCASAPPIEIDEEKLAVYENASWEVIPLAGQPLGTNGFQAIDREEIAYLSNISIAKEFDENKWYALAAPEFPNTYYYLVYGLVLFQGKSLMGNKSTTIDAERFAAINDYTNTFHSASWTARALPAQPPLTEFEKLNLFNAEANAETNALPTMGLGSDTWYEITAPELPGITFLLYKTTGTAVSISEFYKRVD